MYKVDLTRNKVIFKICLISYRFGNLMNLNFEPICQKSFQSNSIILDPRQKTQNILQIW